MRLTILIICLACLSGCAKYQVTITDPNTGIIKELKVFSWRKFPEGAAITYDETGFQFGTPSVTAGGEIEALRDIILGRPGDGGED